MNETATVDRWYCCYQRGLITLSELIEGLTEVDREYGAKPITRSELLANRSAAAV